MLERAKKILSRSNTAEKGKLNKSVPKSTNDLRKLEKSTEGHRKDYARTIEVNKELNAAFLRKSTTSTKGLVNLSFDGATSLENSFVAATESSFCRKSSKKRAKSCLKNCKQQQTSKDSQPVASKPKSTKASQCGKEAPH